MAPALPVVVTSRSLGRVANTQVVQDKACDGTMAQHSASAILHSGTSDVSAKPSKCTDRSFFADSLPDLGVQRSQSAPAKQDGPKADGVMDGAPLPQECPATDHTEPGPQLSTQPSLPCQAALQDTSRVCDQTQVGATSAHKGTSHPHVSQQEPEELSGQRQVAQKSPVAVEEAMAIELFAGSANLSKAFRSVGMQVVAVDTKDAPQIKIVKLNLLRKGSVDLVHRLMQTRNVILVHMVPPCSTSSQARRIRRSPRDPKPLRSWCVPDGLDNLGFLDRARVSQANRLCQVCHDVAILCTRLGIWWSIENPTSSIIWIATPLRNLWQALR